MLGSWHIFHFSDAAFINKILHLKEEAMLKKIIPIQRMIVERTNVKYLLQPTLMVLMFINVRRVATGLLWTIDPNVAFYLTWFGCLCLINTGLATICCTFDMKGESPTYCYSIIICMCFSTTLFRRCPSRDYCLFYERISTKEEEKD